MPVGRGGGGGIVGRANKKLSLLPSPPLPIFSIKTPSNKNQRNLSSIGEVHFSAQLGVGGGGKRVEREIRQLRAKLDEKLKNDRTIIGEWLIPGQKIPKR